MAVNTDPASYAASLDGVLGEVAVELSAILDAALPGATGTIWHGHPVWMVDREPRAGFKAYASHVTFMIWNGDDVEDPTGRLVAGPRMSTVKLRTTDDVDPAQITRWLKAAHPG